MKTQINTRSRQRVLLIVFLCLLVVSITIFVSSFLVNKNITPIDSTSSTFMGLDEYETYVSSDIKVSLQEIESLLNQRIPETLSNIKAMNIGGPISNETVEFSLSRNQIEVSGLTSGIDLNSSITGEITLRACIEIAITCVPFQEKGQLSGNVNTKVTDIKLTPDWNLSYNLETKMDINDVKFNVLGNDIYLNIADSLKEVLSEQLSKLTTNLQNDVIHSLELYEVVQELWTDINGTIKLSDSPPTWVQLRPLFIAVEPLSVVDNDSLNSSISIKTIATTHIGQEPDILDTLELPKLNETMLGDRFILRSPIVIDLASATEQLMDCCFQESFKVGENIDFQVKSMSLSGSNNQLIIKLNFNTQGGNILSRASGTITLKGVPIWNADQMTLTADKLSIDSRTNNILFETYDWLAEPILIPMFKERFVLDLSEEISQTKVELNSYLEDISFSDKVSHNISIDEFTIDNLWLENHDIIIVIEAIGKLVIRLQNLS